MHVPVHQKAPVTTRNTQVPPMDPSATPRTTLINQTITRERTIINTNRAVAGPGLYTGPQLSPQHPTTEAFGGFIKAGWTPAELGESHGKSSSHQARPIPPQRHTNTQWRKAPIISSPWKPWCPSANAVQHAAFQSPRAEEVRMDDPDNPEHTPELEADIEEMARLWRNREASWHAKAVAVEDQPIPTAL